MSPAKTAFPAPGIAQNRSRWLLLRATRAPPSSARRDDAEDGRRRASVSLGRVALPQLHRLSRRQSQLQLCFSTSRA